MRRRRCSDGDGDAIVAAMSQTPVDLPPMQLGYPRTELRRKLVDAVLRGEKTATAGLRADYEPHTDEPLPRIGDRCALHSFDDEPVAVVETTEVRVLRAGDVDLAFALDEGEDFETVADWRRAHEEFWTDQEIGDDTLIVAERFRVVERL
jgi:uncharacterized protein YhfF